ncbi:hypothetical protein CAPTEDRAFT_182819 [Capitella teleta]|uniref:Glycosyl transferase family 1 domain-containing protein n=1 Tax=Capitella teleta TaxID=283909 RepID=R7ULY2_CAPTE|nr:hypothetical protein CAPTEDRAFT_182819 [Capitella teleta]|eukprot:ELU07068.1 hypothetical protein CAPTEDRAFT_182819 [Capitella teleta]
MTATNGHCVRRLLIVGQLRPFSGNNSTALRIAGYLEEEGFACILRDISSFESSSAFICVLRDLRIDAAIGIHALRAGALLKDCPLPYCLIFGGTDLNEYSRQAKDLMTMKTASHHSTSLVTFCQPMSDTVHLLWPEEMHKLREIPQAVLMRSAPDESEAGISRFLNVAPESKCFVLVAGLRPVKDPLYLLRAFTDWHLEMRSRGQEVHLLIIGPQIDAEYSAVFHQELKSAEGVHLLGALSLSLTHRIIQQTFCLVNTSRSEGMCMAILEAMHLGTAVMARDIPSNRALIAHQQNGILFASPQDFVVKAEELLSNEELRLKIIKTAKVKVGQQHNYLREKSSYLEIAQELIQATKPKENGCFVDCASSPTIATKTCINGSFR